MEKHKADTTSSTSNHIDLRGNIFELPDFTINQIRNAIPPHCFRPSITRSMFYAARDYFYAIGLIYMASHTLFVSNIYLRTFFWTAYTILQGMVFTGIWILAHECGHGAFSKSKRLNNIMGLLMHSFLLVPYYSWRITHSRHHHATGNMAHDTAFVPQTRDMWIKNSFGKDADPTSVDFMHLSEDAPLVTLWHCIIYQVFGWPAHLVTNLSGQEYGPGFPRRSHFYFGEDSTLFKKEQMPLIVLSDLGITCMLMLIVWGSLHFGWAQIAIYYWVPYLWVNHWIVAITFLHHTDGTLPHYTNSQWTFTRGATATIDRNFGFIDTHLFHNIISTHVCHHLVSTIPFYHAVEASKSIRKVMGKHYRADTQTPFMRAFWNNHIECKFVEESEGMDGSGVFMFRNLYGRGTPPVVVVEKKSKLSTANMNLRSVSRFSLARMWLGAILHIAKGRGL